MNRKLRNTLIITGTLIIIVAAILLIDRTGIFRISIFESEESIVTYIANFGAWAPLTFLIIQILQVIIAPIPGNITTMAGGSLFGFTTGFILGQIGIYIGGTAAFYISRKLGQKAAAKLIGQKIFDKYNMAFKGKSVFIIFMAFLLPFIPDDVLCFLAGLSTMSFPVFSLIFFLGRMPGTALSALMGAGLISFSIKEWFLIGSVVLALIAIVSIYKKEIEAFVFRVLKIKDGGSLSEPPSKDM